MTGEDEVLDGKGTCWLAGAVFERLPIAVQEIGETLEDLGEIVVRCLPKLAFHASILRRTNIPLLKFARNDVLGLVPQWDLLLVLVEDEFHRGLHIAHPGRDEDQLLDR